MKAASCLVLISLLGCRQVSSEERHEQIKQIALGCDSDAWAELVSIAGAGDRETRCWVVQGLDNNFGGESPQLYIGSVWQRCAERLDKPELRRALEALLQDQSMCGARSVSEQFYRLVSSCPVPGLEKYFEAHHLDDAIGPLRFLAAWHPNPAAKRVEELVADGDAAAFRRMLAALSAPPGERAQMKDTMLAGLLWLRRRVGLTRGRRCFDELGEAIIEGDLGADLAARLDDSDPEIRAAILRIFEMRPRPSIRARLQELETHDPDQDVQYEANGALYWLDHGGEFTEFSHEASEIRRTL
jgi:hypothetical protein